jgi:hypothetical protein
MAQTHTNLSVTNAIVTVVHSILAPGGIDLKPSLDAKAGIDVSTTPLATTRRALDGKRGVGTIYDDPKTSFELLPNSAALRDFFYLWRQYDKLNGATKAEFMYVTYGDKRVQHVFEGGVLEMLDPMAAFREDAQNQKCEVSWDFTYEVGL